MLGIKNHNETTMKVCQLTAVDFTVKHFLLPLIDGMLRQKWSVSIVCSGGIYTKELKKKGYDIHSLEIPRNLNIFLLTISFFKLFKFFKLHNFDIVHVHTPVASVVARLAAKFAKVPLVVYTAHGFYFHENMPSLKYYFYLFVEKVLAYFTNLLFVQSREDFNTAIKYKFLNEKKIFCIGNGVDVNRFNPKKIKNYAKLKKELGLPINSFVIGCIARIVEEKGLIEFLQATENIIKNFSDVHILLIGERLSSDHNKSIDFEIKKFKKIMKKKLIVLGQREDIPNLLHIMDLFCLPSWREGMSRSIIEAMMMEKPIITTNIRGCREQIVHDINGIIVPVRSKSFLYNAIKKLLNNERKRKEFGAKSREKALRIYDEQKIIKLQIEIIKKIKCIT